MEKFKKAGSTPLSKDESRKCNGGMSYEEYKRIINHGGCVFFPVLPDSCKNTDIIHQML